MTGHERASQDSRNLCDQLFEALQKLIPDLQRSPTQGSCGLYQDGRTRFAYVYKYVASNADYLYQMLRSDPNTNKLFEKEKLLVSCIGGGPGSDLIGLLKFITRHGEHVERITCYLCDQEQAWADSWTDISDKLDLPLMLNANFQALDVTDSTSWQKQKKFLNSDIFTLSFFVSEVVRFKNDDLEKFWSTLFGEARTGACFVFIDNAHSDFTDYFDELCEQHKIKTLTKAEYEITPSSDEQKADLGDYLKIFGEYPRMKQQLAYRLLRK